MTGPETVGAIMTRTPRTIDRNQSLEAADRLVTGSSIRHLPVLDGTRVVGVLSQRDLFQAALSRALGYGSVGRARLLDSIPVKEVMSEPAVTVEADMPIRDAARLMVARKIGCLP
ncbi:MAG: CBS domain-containing protein, partial [Vicinamibacteria bacterium]